MKDLDVLIVTVAKTLASSGVVAEEAQDEIIPLAITIAEKLVSNGYTKEPDFSVDVFDDSWFEGIYDAVFSTNEANTSEPTPLVDDSFASVVEDAAPEAYSFESPYDDDELELDSGDEPQAEDDLLEAPASPNILYPERAQRKELNPQKAEVNAPSWAILKPKA